MPVGEQAPASAPALAPVARGQCTTHLSITVNAALYNLSNKQLHAATDDKTRYGSRWWPGGNGHVLKRWQLTLVT